MITFSFIIITRNRKMHLIKCLQSVKKIATKSCEVIVVDNNSNDSTVKMLSKIKKIVLIKNNKNQGVAAARNIGIKRSTGKYIVLLDDDAYIVSNDFIQKSNRFLEENKNIGILGPKILYPNGKAQKSARNFPTIPALIWRGTILHNLFPNVKYYKEYIIDLTKVKKAREVDWVIGACQIIRKSLINKIGFLDEKYFFGYEDVDFCLRTKKAGYKVVYNPDIEIRHHYHRKSAEGLINRAKLQHVKSIILYYYKHLNLNTDDKKNSEGERILSSNH